MDDKNWKVEMNLSIDWLHRFQSGHCDGHVIYEPDPDLHPDVRVGDYGLRETTPDEIDRRWWPVYDARRDPDYTIEGMVFDPIESVTPPRPPTRLAVEPFWLVKGFAQWVHQSIALPR